MPVGSLRYAGGQKTGLRAATYAPQRRTQAVFLPAPVLGLNTEDAPEIMQPGYAVDLVNWWPGENGLTTRGGSSPWCVGLNGWPVESLMVWNSTTLFAAADTELYRLPPVPGTDALPVLVKSGLNSARISSVNFGNDGGVFLCCCNGSDAPFYHDGAEWAECRLQDSKGGVFDGSDFFAVVSHLSRLWWLKKGSQSVFYGAPNAIQGRVYELPTGAYLTRGGSLVGMGILTQDGLLGSNDLLALVSSEGEVLLYSGTNPDEASAWRMVGKAQIARPLGGGRCCIPYETDLLVLTESGLVGIQKAVSQAFPGLRDGITEKVQSRWHSMVEAYGTDGWSLCMYHLRGLIVVNAPGPLGHQQLVCNPKTKAWGELQGWERVSCFAEYQGCLVGGHGSAVFALDWQYADAVGGTDFHTGSGVWSVNAQDPEGAEWAMSATDENGGTWEVWWSVPQPVLSRVQHGYVSPGGSRKKRFTLARPYLLSAGQPEAHFALSCDFMGGVALARMFDERPWGGAEWYTGAWASDVLDTGGDTWSLPPGERQMRSRWMQATGCGYFVAPLVMVKTGNQSVTYTGCEVQYETGNTL